MPPFQPPRVEHQPLKVEYVLRPTDSYSRAPPLPMPNLPALQINKGISKRINLADSSDKAEETGFPTFRFNNLSNIESKPQNENK